MFTQLLLFIAFQIPLQQTGADWEALARPLMTSAESKLFDQLEPEDRIRFRGYFISRRVQQLDSWSASGLYLPDFFYPKPYGDIRDLLLAQLGEPKEEVFHPSILKMPSLWRYPEREFAFLADGAERVKLAPASLAVWDQWLESKILHPQLRYDFRESSFGRMRLPDKLEWHDTLSPQVWIQPNQGGAAATLSLPIPQSFLQRFKEEASGQANVERVKVAEPLMQPPSPDQRLELLIFLKTKAGESLEAVPPDRVRHGSARVLLDRVSDLFFECQLPVGNFEAEFLVYSGYLNFGIRATAKLRILPTELPRLADPILSQEWGQAGLIAPKPGELLFGNQNYKIALRPAQDRPTRVLLQSGPSAARLQILASDGRAQFLQPTAFENGWSLFELPPAPLPARILAWREEPAGALAALSSWGAFEPGSEWGGIELAASARVNYLKLEQLEFSGLEDWASLFINGKPYLAGKRGRFPFVPLDWGQSAELRMEPLLDAKPSARRFEIRRTPVYEELRTKNRYLVVGTRKVDGGPELADCQVFVEGKAVPPLKVTAYDALPKLWGIVVNDALLHSSSWPEMRQSLISWFRDNTRPADLLYLVQISHRPELIVAPTSNRALLQASLASLTPSTRNENYFTLRYLLDALVHLPQHQTRPHQVLLLTHQLTAETSQMENLIPELRATGLQLYNLEFPFEFKPESQEQLAGLKPNQLDEMKETQRQEDFLRMTTRDNIQDSRNITGVITPLTLRFPKKAKQKELERERVREEAFRVAFNQQLAQRTAGLAQISGPVSGVATLQTFLAELTRWQAALRHLALPLPYFDESMIGVQTPQNTTSGWTIVNWNPKEP